MQKWFRRVSWFLSVIFLVVVVYPLAIERFVSGNDWKSMFASYYLKDEEGKLHAGFFSWARLVKDVQFFEYAWEVKKEGDLSYWRYNIAGVDEDKLKRKSGFLWADKGFLWSHQNLIGGKENFAEEGRRLKVTVPITDQTEMTLPGAPWDVKTPNLSYFGVYPKYKVEYDNRDFKLDLAYHSRTRGWFKWGEGKVRIGDFFTLSMNELSCDIDGTITHKQSGKTFHVRGNGILEDAIGLPYNWIDKGGHTWCDVHFPNGWSGSVQYTTDDWQWGYSQAANIGYIFDPEKNEFHRFHRIDYLDSKMAKEEYSGITYPVLARWRCISRDGTLEITMKNVTAKPRSTPISYTPFTMEMVYGIYAYDARFIRADGTTVELKNGYGTMEHYKRVIPDYRYTGPGMLILLILSWGATALVRAREGKKPGRGILVWMAVLVFSVLCLYWYWSAGAVLLF